MTYRLTAKFYDLFGSKNDLARALFYKELALQSGGKALELGVGTARVAIPLARAGVTVVGIDNSVQMLRVARGKLPKESAAVRKRVILKRGDMRNFELKQPFSLIYIPASTVDLEQVPPGKPEASWWIDRKEIEGGKMVVQSVFTRRGMTKNRCSLDLFFDVYKNGKLLERYHEYGERAR